MELAQTYMSRWPAHENAIREWLIPLGIDVNHGYAMTLVINSEIAKKREVLQKRLDNVQRWADGARKRMHNASKLYRKRCQLWGCGFAITIFQPRMRMRAGTACRFSFNYRGGSPGELKRLRLNSIAGATLVVAHRATSAVP